MSLFEVAILELPTKKEVEEGTGEEKLIFGPKPVVSTSPDAAAVRAVMDYPEKFEGVNRARMEILVRPFA